MSESMKTTYRIFCPFLFLLLASGDAGSQEIQCNLTQLTQNSTGSSIGGSDLAAYSSWMAYTGRPSLMGDLLGASSEILLYDLEKQSTQQITDNSSYDGNPSLSSDAQWIVYESQANDTGENADGNREIVLFSLESGKPQQITDSSQLGNFRPKLTRDGTKAFFWSSNNLTGDNPSERNQMFVYDRTQKALTQVSQSMVNSAGFWVDADGRHLLITTEEDLLGQNADGNEEVYVLDLTTEELIQLTVTESGRNHSAQMSTDGRWFLFGSSSEEFVGPNPSGLPFPLVLDRQENQLIQLASEPSNLFSVMLSADGRRVVTNLNSEVTLHDLVTGESVLLAFDPGVISAESMNSQGTLITIRTTADLTGDNPENEFQIFLADCPVPGRIFADGFEIGDTSVWSSTQP